MIHEKQIEHNIQAMYCPFVDKSVDVREDAGVLRFNAYDLGAAMGLEHAVVLELIASLDSSDRDSSIDGTPYLRTRGMFRMVLGSDTAIAKRIINWLASDVLTALMETGTYSLQGDDPCVNPWFH